jgi:hypothetical protein
MSRIAKGNARCSKQALAQIAKGDGLGFPLGAAEGRNHSCYSPLGLLGAETGISAMRNINIDRTHSYAILREIGDRLRAHLREEPELPEIFRKKIDRLRELEASSSPRGR